MGRARRARKIAATAAYGGGGVAALGAAAGGRRLGSHQGRGGPGAPRSSASPFDDSPDDNGVYGSGRGEPYDIVVLGDSSAAGMGTDAAHETVRARRTDLFEVDPWVIIANSFDFMHLRYVHGLKFDFDESSIRWDDRAIAYEMTFTMPDGLVAHQRISVSGTNTVSYVTGGDVDSMGLFTSTPVGHGSQSYYVAASPHGPQDEVEERLRLQEHIADELLKDDTRALEKMRFQQGAFVSEDRSMIRYLRYVRSFPTNDPSRWLS